MKTILTTTAAALVLSASAFAQTAVIEITGATAFRAGALDSIRAGFNAAGTPKVAFAGATFNASGRAILRGDFKCSDGTTLTDIVVRTSFSGSTEGLKALDTANYTPGAPAGAFDEEYFTVASISALAAGSTTSGFGGAREKAPADIAFSDVEPTAVPTIDSSDFTFSPVGAVTFTMLKNDGTTAAPFNNLTNVSSQNFRALMTNGVVPLSIFTGIPADGSSRVVAVGRNDGSGTRVVYLAETGYGATNLVQQFQASNTTSNGAGGPGTTGTGIINQMQQVPAGTSSETDTNAGVQSQNFGTSNTSTIFGNPVVNGNGGYQSGSQLKRIFGYSTKSTQLVRASGSQIAPAAPIALVTSLSTADAIGAIGEGAVALTYDGYGITPAAPLSAADKAKVTQGQYTLWSFEQIIGKDLDTNEQCIFDTVVANIGPIIETNGTGIRFSDVAVSRSVTGATVIPPQ